MVKSLTDAEPQEPYWEDMKHLTLSNKSLESLHGLDEFCERLLVEEHVAVIPGSAFGCGGDGHVRCAYAASVDHIEKALERMDRFIRRHA